MNHHRPVLPIFVWHQSECLFLQHLFWNADINFQVNHFPTLSSARSSTVGKELNCWTLSLTFSKGSTFVEISTVERSPSFRRGWFSNSFIVSIKLAIFTALADLIAVHLQWRQTREDCTMQQIFQPLHHFIKSKMNTNIKQRINQTMDEQIISMWLFFLWRLKEERPGNEKNSRINFQT